MTRGLLFLCATAVLIGLASAAFAQTTVELTDRLYTDLELWQGEGLIAKLPPLRPYPIQLVKKLLREVGERGSAADRKRAEGYLSHMDKLFEFTATPYSLVRAKVGSGGSGSYWELGAIGTFQGTLTPWATYSTDFGERGMSGQGGSLLPFSQRPAEDVVYDGSAAPLPDLGITLNLSLESQTAFGSSSTYFQAGMMRDSFGPFFGDSIVLSPTAPQAGNFSFTWQQGLFTYTMLLMALSATTNAGGGPPLPNKFLSLHDLEIYPTPWLEIGGFETTIWGGRFDPLYLLPGPTLDFYAQGFVGFPDNSFIGLSAGVKLPASVRANAMVYIDDLNPVDLFKLDFNTKLLIAGQAGVAWTPNLGALKRVSINYTLITPYTYSHQNQLSANDSPTYPGANYENYTNEGENIGPSLDPNSDRIEIKALLRPLSSTDITFFGRFIRHGNASEGIAGINNPTGTIFDDGFAGTAMTFTPGYAGTSQYLRFLDQSVLERVIQAGFDAKVYLPTPIGELDAELGYTFEYAMNTVDPASGNPQSGVNATNNYLTVSAGIRL